ncbi:MAG TPA: class I SAM-dependent methyltransferase [Gaiellaceae bacterium]|jgi:ubiquinone/menaquinone biosynthesis C-methylase UbiE|nr:class I SAM-dependent methyltransferase [Gaiellaceae bacterium]
MTGNAERRATLQRERAAALAERLEQVLKFDGDERALDVGAGTGALAFALAPRVREVVAVELDEELADRARADAPANVEVLVADGEHLPFERASFDFGGTLLTLHHTPRPELLVAELTRVTRPGGTILVVDQLAPADPLVALDLTRFERARDPSTTRVLADADLRGLFDSNGLKLLREEVVHEPRDLEAYLDLAGCEGAARDNARSHAPSGYEAVVGWYVLSR